MTNKKRNVFTICALMLVLWTYNPLFCMAQDDESVELDDFSSFSTDDFFKMQLPSINVVIENAKLRPKVRLFSVQEKIQENLLNKEKRGWTEFFSVGTGYNYGNVGVFSSYSDRTTPLYSSSSTGTSTSWQIGFSFNLSLSSLLDLRPRIQRQKLNVEAVQLQRLEVLDEQKEEIINLYAQVNLQLSILKQQSEALMFARTASQIAEKDFLTGKKDISDLTAIKQNLSQELTSYESAKAELVKSLLRLEIITNTKFFKNK